VSVRDSDLISRPASRKVSHIQAVERNSWASGRDLHPQRYLALWCSRHGSLL